MPITIKELVITVKTEQRESRPITQQRPEERQRTQEKGQDALVREAVEQTLRVLEAKRER